MRSFITRIGVAPPLIAVFVVLALVLSFPAAQWAEPYFETVPQLELTSLVVSSVLTVALVFAYLHSNVYQRHLTEIQDDQTDIQEKQRDIQDEQTQILARQKELQNKQQKAEFRPQITLNEFKPYPKDMGGILLRLSNVGRGAAMDLQMRVVPCTSANGVTLEENVHRLVQHKSDRSDWIDGRANDVKSDETDVDFRGSVNVSLEKGNTNPTNTSNIGYFGRITKDLYRNGERKYRFKIYIEATNALNESFSEEVLDLVVPIKNNTSFEEAVNYSMNYEIYKNNQRKLGLRQDQMEDGTGPYP